MLRDAAGKGVQVSLLLGDPSWIEPPERHQLTDLLAKLRGLAFISLHLDLEVEQLGVPVPDQRLKDWLETLRVASSVSPWPVEISSHHRWFADPKPGQTCVPCALPDAGVRQVSLMIYTRNPNNSARMAEQSPGAGPTCNFAWHKARSRNWMPRNPGPALRPNSCSTRAAPGVNNCNLSGLPALTGKPGDTFQNGEPS